MPNLRHSKLKNEKHKRKYKRTILFVRLHNVLDRYRSERENTSRRSSALRLARVGQTLKNDALVTSRAAGFLGIIILSWLWSWPMAFFLKQESKADEKTQHHHRNGTKIGKVRGLWLNGTIVQLLVWLLLWRVLIRFLFLFPIKVAQVDLNHVCRDPVLPWWTTQPTVSQQAHFIACPDRYHKTTAMFAGRVHTLTEA